MLGNQITEQWIAEWTQSWCDLQQLLSWDTWAENDAVLATSFEPQWNAPWTCPWQAWAVPWARQGVGEGYFQVSLISIRLSHRWHFNSIRLAMALPITWVIALVARRAKYIAVRSSVKALESCPDLSMSWRSLAWNTWSTDIVCRDEPAWELGVSLLFSGINKWREQLQWLYTRWVEGSPCLGELVVDWRHKRSWPLVRGWLMKEPLIEDAGAGSSRAIHSRPSSSIALVRTLISSVATLGHLEMERGLHTPRRNIPTPQNQTSSTAISSLAMPKEIRHELTVSAASAWVLPRQAMDSLCPSESSKGSLHELHSRCDIWNNITDFSFGNCLICSDRRGRLDHFRCQGSSTAMSRGVSSFLLASASSQSQWRDGLVAEG